jgi:hypothetical protein
MRLVELHPPGGQPSGRYLPSYEYDAAPEEGGIRIDPERGERRIRADPAAGELASVDVEQIRRWAADGAVEIEQRGDLEVVRLDVVEALLASPPAPGRDRRYMLRRLLDGARLETKNVIELQMLAREREPAAAS